MAAAVFIVSNSTQINNLLHFLTFGSFCKTLCHRSFDITEICCNVDGVKEVIRSMHTSERAIEVLHIACITFDDFN